MSIERIIKIILVPVILALIVKSINVFSFFVAELIYVDISNWDTDNSFLVLSVHHIVQALIALTIIVFYGKIRNIPFGNFGFGKTGFKQAFRYVLIFIIIWTFIQTLSGFILVKFFGEPILFGFPLTPKNYLGRFAFQLFLSGTSEEILFRVMVIVVLNDVLKNILSKRTLFFYLIAISTLIFMFDHINFSLSPFGITHFNVLQQFTLLIFGIFYGWLFIKFKSYWAVAIAHGLLNGIISLSTLFLYFLIN